MGEETWTAEELFEGLELAPALVSQLEKLGLLQVLARDADGHSLYGSRARVELEKVLDLMELGYELKDISAIAKKVGLPRRKKGLFRRTPVCIPLRDLSQRAGVNVDIVESWVAAGLVTPALTSERGVDLFVDAQVEKVRLLGELQVLGAHEDDLGCAARLLRALRSGELEASDDDPTPELEGLVLDLERLRAVIRGRQGALRHWTRELAKLRRALARRRRGKRLKRRKDKGSS